jgi:hypothetical protein
MRSNHIQKLFFVFSILLLFSGSACKKNSNKFDYIIFGKYFSECGGNCASFFRLTNNKLYGDRMDYFMGAKDIKFQKFALSSDNFRAAHILADSLPDFFKTETGQTLGCPDCHDQGGFYLEIRTSGNTRVFNIDPEVRRMPKEVMDYISLLDQTIASLPQE